MDVNVIKLRAEELLKNLAGSDRSSIYEARAGALNICRQLYGAESVLERELVSGAVRGGVAAFHTAAAALRTIIAEIDAGLVGSLVSKATGEVLADFLDLARAALRIAGDDGVKVAAVLTAASYEDSIRRLGELRAGVTGRPKLEEVIKDLRDAEVLAGAQHRSAVNFLAFRNDALHADWEKITNTDVEGVMVYVQGLLDAHFS